MKNGVTACFRACLAGASALVLSACTTSDWDAIATGMAMAADEMAVTMAMVPAYGCDYNSNRDLVCDDTGDGYADRYGTEWDYAPTYYSGPPTRVNDYGEAYQYDGSCDCWRREPSLDTYPQ